MSARYCCHCGEAIEPWDGCTVIEDVAGVALPFHSTPCALHVLALASEVAREFRSA